MRKRLLLMGLSGLMLTAVAGDALSRQAAAPPAARPARVAPGAVARLPVDRVPGGPAAGGPATPGRGVDWASAVGGLRQTNGSAEKVAGRMDRNAIDRTELPILVPVDPGLMGGARLYSFGDYYTISTEQPGVSISLSGNAAPIPVDAKLTLRADGGENVVIQRTVDGQIASYSRYGVLYTVEVTCADLKDARCTNDLFVRQLYAKTNGVILGKSARKAAGLGG